MPSSSKASSNRQSSVPTGAKRAISPNRHGRISPFRPLNKSIADESAAQVGYAFRLGVTDRVGLSVVAVGDVQRGDGDHARLCLTGRQQLGEARLSGGYRQQWLRTCR